MREIKFRGMDIEGRWFYGNIAVLTENVRHLKQGHYISNSVGLPFAYQVRPETVGQYTGLKDKNGKEIYEGDILQEGNTLYKVRWIENFAKIGVMVVKSDYVLTRGCTFPIHQYVKLGSLECIFEVIGNIYDYKELLEVVSND